MEETDIDADLGVLSPTIEVESAEEEEGAVEETDTDAERGSGDRGTENGDMVGGWGFFFVDLDDFLILVEDLGCFSAAVAFGIVVE